MNKTIAPKRRQLAAAGLGLLGAAAGFGPPARAAAPHTLERSPPSPGLAALGLADAWLNAPPLTPDALRGKVVLIQFWTYSCINWLRTLPYVRAWVDRYGKDGLVVVGVHAPEFGFEHDPDNVRRALHDMRIAYPVAIDNRHAVWTAFDNNDWPALYFIDAGGRVRDRHFGEGDYERSERTLQTLLAEAGRPATPRASARMGAEGLEAAADWDDLGSPENYLGHARTERFASPEGLAPDDARLYTAPPRLGLNGWALAGGWTVGGESAVANTAGGRIACRFHARDLHMVLGAGSGAAAAPFRVLLDGAPPGAAHGLDVDAQGRGVLAQPRLYQLIRQRAPVVDRLFTIDFLQPGVQAYAFTFG
jgi:thiol-disulfide isomerase/thioredoxin